MRVSKLLFIAVMAGLLISTHAEAANYRLPADPIGPTSMETCKRLSAQYRKIIRAIDHEAERAGDQAWSLVVSNGVGAGDGYYAKAKRLFNKSTELRYKIANPAIRRCRRQVYAYERRLAAQKRAASNKSYVSNRRFISNSQPAPQKNLVSKRRFLIKKGPDSLANVSNTVRNAPRQAGYSFLKEATISGLEGSKIRGTRATGAIDNIIETVNYFRNRSNRRTSANKLNKLDYLGSMGGEIFRNPLQQAVFKAAMGQIMEINRSALKDFNAAFQKRDGGVPAASFYLSQISAKSYSENLLLDAGIQGVESQDDALTTALKASLQVLENIKKDRMEATRVAIAKDRQIKARYAEALKKQRYDEAQARLRKQNEQYRQEQYRQKQARLRQQQERRRARERQARLEREREREAEQEPEKTFNFSDAFNNTLQQMQNGYAQQLNTLREQQRIQQQRAQQQRVQRQRAQQQDSQRSGTYSWAEWCANNPDVDSPKCNRQRTYQRRPTSNCVNTRDRTCGIK